MLVKGGSAVEDKADAHGRPSYPSFLFVRPPNFSKIAPKFIGNLSDPTRFNLSNFVRETGLGQAVAGNFFFAANSA